MPKLSLRGLTSRVRQVLQRPGTASLSTYRTLLAEVNERGSEYADFTDAELAEAFADVKETATVEGTNSKAEIHERWVQVCALTREAADRAIGERPFDTQILGALAMLDGHIVEMATGEGKTLAAVLAAAGFRVRGDSVHVLTVNDYLAKRDAEWMRPVYETLGLTVGYVVQTSTPQERRDAYEADITYVTVTECGFDFLRDRLVIEVDALVQPPLVTAIVDEADSLLVDEARVPLVLGGSAPTEDDTLHSTAELVRRLKPGSHYRITEDGRNVQLTESGAAMSEKLLGIPSLYDAEQLPQLTAINLALHAESLLKRDVDYLVRDGKVHLINEFRGRVAELQRWPDGLQAAVEAKEELAASDSGEVLSSVTVQAFIRLYGTVCGMTGTAVPAAEELREFFDLEVAVIPPNTPNVREDEPDRLYSSPEDKETALLETVAEVHAEGRPVLIGTLDVAESERLAEKLVAAGLECSVLNAKNDAEEARIISEAGAYGAITVSTQIAGRGVDILLGGSDGADRERVVETGGLYILGFGRHESRRIDDQLRGRAGRQGDPGGSVFFVGVTDALIQRYGEDVVPSQLPDEDGQLRERGLQESIEHAQRVSEGQNLEIHRNTWKYNLLIEQQRQIIHERRDEVLRTEVTIDRLSDRCGERYDEVVAEFGAESVARSARLIELYHLDRAWADHLAELNDLREGVHLRALGRLNPLDEFHATAIPTFESMIAGVSEKVEKTFNEVEFAADGPKLDEAGLTRPSTTWTYVVRENPFGSEWDRALRGLGLRRSR